MRSGRLAEVSVPDYHNRISLRKERSSGLLDLLDRAKFWVDERRQRQSAVREDAAALLKMRGPEARVAALDLARCAGRWDAANSRHWHSVAARIQGTAEIKR